MALLEFEPHKTPDLPAKKNTKARVLKAPFGDGYVGRTGDGLNSIQRTRSATWSLMQEDEANYIDEFFETQAGVTPFLYTFPNDVERQWVVEEWTREFDGPLTESISATFTQDFSINA